MAYYAIVEPTPTVTGGRRCPGELTEDEEETNIAALAQWRDYIGELLERSVPVQVFPRHFRRGDEVRRLGFVVRLTDHEAFLCLVGDTPRRLITLDLLESVGNLLPEWHRIELNDWRHRQRQLQRQVREAIERDHETGRLTEDQYTELLANLALNEQFVTEQTRLPRDYTPQVYDPTTHQLVNQTFTVRLNGVPITSKVRDDLMTIVIDRNTDPYLKYVSVSTMRFDSPSDERIYYRNNIPWYADQFIGEMAIDLNIDPDRAYLSVSGLTPGVTVTAVDPAALNRVKAGEQANILFVPRLSDRWNDESIRRLLKFFDPEHHQEIKTQWWLTYDQDQGQGSAVTGVSGSTDGGSAGRGGRYYLNLTITFPPDRRQAGLFKFMFSPLRFEPPTEEIDYRLDNYRWPDDFDPGADGIIYYRHPRHQQRTVVSADVFKRQAALGLPTNHSYDSLRRLYEHLITYQAEPEQETERETESKPERETESKPEQESKPKPKPGHQSKRRTRHRPKDRAQVQ